MGNKLKSERITTANMRRITLIITMISFLFGCDQSRQTIKPMNNLKSKALNPVIKRANIIPKIDFFINKI
jgi:hypothetical protein